MSEKNLMELKHGGVYFMKMTEEMYNPDQHKVFVEDCRRRGVTVITALVSDQSKVNIAPAETIADLLKTSFTDSIKRRLHPVLGPKAAELANVINTEIRSKIKAVLAGEKLN